MIYVIFSAEFRDILLPVQVDIAAGGWHSTALTDEGEVLLLLLTPWFSCLRFVVCGFNIY